MVIIERYIILTITLLFSVVLSLVSTTTISATINNYFDYKDENDNEKDIYREKYKKEREKYDEEKYKERTHRLDDLCDDPQATKKYGEICEGYGNYYKDRKDECEDKNGKWENNRCEFDYDIGTEKQFELDEVCNEIKDDDDLYSEICKDND